MATAKKIKAQNCPDSHAEKILTAINNLENQKQRPIYFAEFYQEMLREGREDDKGMLDTVTNIYNLFKDDKVLCDTEMNLFSLNQSLQRSPTNDQS